MPVSATEGERILGSVQNISEQFYTLPSLPGLVLPKRLLFLDRENNQEVFFARRLELVASEAYSATFEEIPQMISRSIGISIINPNEEDAFLYITALWLGVFQNPQLTEDELQELWFDNDGELSVAATLLNTQILWSNPALDAMVALISDDLSYFQNVNPEHYLAVARYTRWSAENCHILSRINYPIVWDAFHANPNISEDIKIMAGLVNNVG